MSKTLPWTTEEIEAKFLELRRTEATLAHVLSRVELHYSDEATALKATIIVLMGILRDCGVS